MSLEVHIVPVIETRAAEQPDPKKEPTRYPAAQPQPVVTVANLQELLETGGCETLATAVRAL